MEFVIEIRVKDGEVVETKTRNVEEVVERVSCYAKIIDPSWIGWYFTSQAGAYTYLKKIELIANDILVSKKRLKLNDVYEMLHLSKTSEGEHVGWRYLEDNSTGDNFVDFGITHKRNIDLINGIGKRAVLDFNVDGII